MLDSANICLITKTQAPRFKDRGQDISVSNIDQSNRKAGCLVRNLCLNFFKKTEQTNKHTKRNKKKL